jgi:menaquinone-9 beta-reductase
MQKTYDVIIIGAGPAGSMAAIRVAELGLSVALLEKDTFPRTKTCGDLVTREGLGLLKSVGLGGWIASYRRVDALRFSAPNGSLLDVPVASPEKEARNRILPRAVLDATLAQVAAAQGANLIEGCRVTSVDISSEVVQVNSSKQSFKGHFLLLADGSHAPITRKLGLLREQPDLMAARQYFYCPHVEPHGPLEFHFQPSILPGYTWVFPEGDGSVNLGAGTYTQRINQKEIDLAEILEDFRRNDPVGAGRFKEAEPIGQMRAHPLRTNVTGTKTHGERFMVLGDAAGLVSPFTGEGITSGMLSGAIAAHFLDDIFRAGKFSAEMTAPYTKALRLRYEGDQQAGYRLRSALRTPALLNRFFRMLQRDSSMADLFAAIMLDEKSPQLMLHVRNLLHLLRG